MVIFEPAIAVWRVPTTHKAVARTRRSLDVMSCTAQGAEGGRRLRPCFSTGLEPRAVSGALSARGHRARDLHPPLSHPRAAHSCRLPLHRLLQKYARRGRLSARNPSIQPHYRAQARGGPAERPGRRATTTRSCSRPSVGWRCSRSTFRWPRRPWKARERAGGGGSIASAPGAEHMHAEAARGGDLAARVASAHDLGVAPCISCGLQNIATWAM